MFVEAFGFKCSINFVQQVFDDDAASSAFFTFWSLETGSQYALQACLRQYYSVSAEEQALYLRYGWKVESKIAKVSAVIRDVQGVDYQHSTM